MLQTDQRYGVVAPPDHFRPTHQHEEGRTGELAIVRFGRGDERHGRENDV